MGPPDASGTVELGYGIDEPFRCRGYATEAVDGITSWAFSQSGVCRVTAQTDPDNAISQRVLLKNDFSRNGDGPEGPLFEKKA
jgi:ribosomal-protein-alanine N-acetyltransferase